MPELGWARGTGGFAEQRGLRRGEWYKVLEDQGAGWLVLDVNTIQIRITKEHLLVRRYAPKGWSVVRLTAEEATIEAQKHGHANDAQHRTHLVCPACHTRHHVAGRPREVSCPKCGKTFPVDWGDQA